VNCVFYNLFVFKYTPLLITLGPARDGTNARNDPLIQRAWYNGWKKLHGMKWQTVDLPNGMNFHVFYAGSVRHNDLESLHDSRIEQLIADLLAHDFQWGIYGDSAYIFCPEPHILARHNNAANTAREIQENKALSSCREVIEWDYDVGSCRLQ